jgi:hypothetical protein
MYMPVAAVVANRIHTHRVEAPTATADRRSQATGLNMRTRWALKEIITKHAGSARISHRGPRSFGLSSLALSLTALVAVAAAAPLVPVAAYYIVCAARGL